MSRRQQFERVLLLLLLVEVAEVEEGGVRSDKQSLEEEVKANIVRSMSSSSTRIMIHNYSALLTQSQQLKPTLLYNNGATRRMQPSVFVRKEQKLHDACAKPAQQQYGHEELDRVLHLFHSTDDNDNMSSDGFCASHMASMVACTLSNSRCTHASTARL